MAYPDELKVWRDEIETMSKRVSNKALYLEEVDKQIAGVIAEYADTEGETREALGLQWLELLAIRGLAAAECDELGRRLGKLRTEEPRRPRY